MGRDLFDLTKTPTVNVQNSKKVSSRMRTARICGSGGGMGLQSQRVWSRGDATGGYGPGYNVERHYTPHHGQTNMCNNITFPQLHL